MFFYSLSALAYEAKYDAAMQTAQKAALTQIGFYDYLEKAGNYGKSVAKKKGIGFLIVPISTAYAFGYKKQFKAHVKKFTLTMNQDTITVLFQSGF